MDWTSTVLSMIATSLGQAERFDHLVLGRRELEPVEARDVGDEVEIWLGGRLAASVRRTDLHVARWDQRRVEALRKRINTNWSIHNILSSGSPALRADERQRVAGQLATRRAALCGDLSELVRLAERTLGVRLAEYFSLTDSQPSQAAKR